MSLEIAGWSVLAALIVILIVQARTTRALERPRRNMSEPLPEALVVVHAIGDFGQIRRCIASVVAQNYPGSLEIAIVTPDPDSDPFAQLTLLSERIRIVNQRPSSPGAVLEVSASTELTPDAVAITVAHALTVRAAAATVLPRIEVNTAREILLLPLVRFLYLTFFSRRRSSCELSLATEGDRLLLDGAELVTERLHTGRLGKAIPLRGTRRVLFTMALVTLFTVPPIVAVSTWSFPWIIAALTGLWLRLRITVRSGEPFISALLHPLTILVAVFSRPNVGD